MSDRVTTANDRPAKAAPGGIVRVRFVRPIRLGPNELEAWHIDRTSTHACEAKQVGIVFTPVTAGDQEIVVPWSNINSYERRL